MSSLRPQRQGRYLGIPLYQPTVADEEVSPRSNAHHAHQATRHQRDQSGFMFPSASACLHSTSTAIDPHSLTRDQPSHAPGAHPKSSSRSFSPSTTQPAPQDHPSSIRPRLLGQTQPRPRSPTPWPTTARQEIFAPTCSTRLLSTSHPPQQPRQRRPRRTHRPPGRRGHRYAPIDLMRGPHSTQPLRGSLSASAEADLRALRLQRRRNREHQRRVGANGGVTAAWNAVGRGRRATTLDAGLAEDDPELPSPLFQPLNPNPPSNRRQRRWVDNWTPDLLHSGVPGRCRCWSCRANRADSDSEPVDRYRLNKRRKLHSNAPEPMYAPIKYGWEGQVDSGPLRLYINHCDGGVLNARSAGYVNYSAENVLRNDLSVYCSKSSKCNLLFGHHADTIFHLDKLIVQAPTMGYTAPYVLRIAIGETDVK